ncbi:unnamed protein product [Notodromas monacha]|uniref:EF-hand domain-containing protein n=1 Tax=Notodromas monacha TaxID=399045 RepID=A0A7R9GBA7_9CRUS|nr:unnamed protein product [Notodromas monacha]CAG0916156.1 unnamed protein product [Notodromas monacha]
MYCLVLLATNEKIMEKASDFEELILFAYYATVNEDGELYMKADVFVRDYLGLHKDEDYNPNAVKLIAGVVDTSKDGLVSFMEFQAFEALLCSPDALYRTAFQMFDTHGNGVVSFQEFSDVIKKTELYQKVPFNLDSDLVKLYFGKEKNKLVSFAEFSQFLHDYHEEHAVQAFKRSDKKEVGFISALDFYNIMVSVKSHLLTPCVKDNLVAVAGGQQVSFPFFVAFNSLLGNMELAKRVFLNATGNDKTADVSREDFIRSAQMMSQITPLEIDILFKLVQLTQQDTRMQFSDLESMTPEQYMKKITSFTLTEVKAVSSPEERGVMIEVLESAYRFTLGAIAGSVGATAVYPIDLVKTRLQNQRSVSFIGELMYKNSWDCLKKVIRHEGFVGLYRGLVPQLVGVAPEKAIKLTASFSQFLIG